MRPGLGSLRRRLAGRSEGAIEQRLQALGEQVAALGESTARIERAQAELLDAQAELRTRARRTQALTARAYEAAKEWPALIERARATPEYELAYTDADPLVSIPIPTYHSPGTLCERALASVLAQTHTNWEAIVVGDHCTDDTEARVRELGDPRIAFHNLPHRENDPSDLWERWAVKGSVPRSVGIERARGRWIAPLSHDDAWDPDHLLTLLDTARGERAEVAYASMRVIDAEDPALPVVRTIGAYPPRLGEWGWQSALFHGSLRFLRYDRNCALASEPNDWNLARRAWEAGVRFHHQPRATVSLFAHERMGEIRSELAQLGLPPSATAETT